MRTVYLHESQINRSEGRLFVTTSFKKKTTLLTDTTYWLNSDSSRAEAMSKINWFCERRNLMLAKGQ